MKKLECCIVRDLLPAYLEDLTEPETTELVRAHLETCPDCQKAEEQMRTPVLVEKAPAKHPLRFLKRVGRMQWAGAIMSVLLILLAMGWVYDREFHYANTEAGWQAAAEDYLPGAIEFAWANEKKITKETPIQVFGAIERGKRLYVPYEVENEDHMHGILTLESGWNHKYRTVDVTIQPSKFTAGIYDTLLLKGSPTALVLMGKDCQGIWKAVVTYQTRWEETEEWEVFEQTYSIEQPQFLWVLDYDELAKSLGVMDKTPSWIVVGGIQLLDENGEDITAQYVNDQIEDTWRANKAAASASGTYRLMEILAVLGILIVRYFLRNPWRR